MEFTTDPKHPKMREALRKAGAPDWYPENAPVHIFEFDDHYPEYVEARCPLCSWKKRNYMNGPIEHIDDGEPWVIHRPPEGGFNNTGIDGVLTVGPLEVVNKTDELRNAFGQIGDTE